MTMTPNHVFVVGAPKAGTSLLFELLGQRPDIARSALKEPNFFSSAINNSPNMRPLTNQRSYFDLWGPPAGEAWRIEASPSYLRSQDGASRIKKAFPNARIIAILREPVARAYSNWKMDVRQGHQKSSFHEAFIADVDRTRSRAPMRLLHEYYRASLYSEDCKRFRDTFGSENVLLLQFSKITNDIDGTLRTIESFLGLPQSICYNVRPVNDARHPVNQTLAKLYRSAIGKRIGGAIPARLRAAMVNALFSGPPDRSSLARSEHLRLFETYFREDSDALLETFGFAEVPAAVRK